MYNIKKDELILFYAEIKKLGADVDEEFKQVSFKIPDDRDDRIEYWVVQDYEEGLLKGSFFIRYDRTHPINGTQQSTKECGEKIEKASKAIENE